MNQERNTPRITHGAEKQVSATRYQSESMDGKWKDFSGDQGDHDWHGEVTDDLKEMALSWKNAAASAEDRQQWNKRVTQWFTDAGFSKGNVNDSKINNI